MTFENIYFGYTGDGVTPTESYPGVPLGGVYPHCLPRCEQRIGR
jgi:hypothetical protein